MTSNLSRPCPLCGGKPVGIGFPYRTKYNETIFSYLKCGTCLSVYVDPIPDGQTFTKMYAKVEYHDSHYMDCSVEPYVESAKLLKKYLPPSSRVLDYGCGMGVFLRALKNEGMTPFGIEFDDSAARYAREATNCEVLSIAEFQALPEKPNFDAIHLGDVLEHLPNPVQTFYQLLDYLVPNGIIFIEGPLETNPSPVYWATRLYGVLKRLLKPDFVANHPPTHLFQTNAKQQLATFMQFDEFIELKYWAVYETGWPYNSTPGLKGAIAIAALALGGKRFLNFTFGNRFRAIFTRL